MDPPADRGGLASDSGETSDQKVRREHREYLERKYA